LVKVHSSQGEEPMGEQKNKLFIGATIN